MLKSLAVLGLATVLASPAYAAGYSAANGELGREGAYGGPSINYNNTQAPAEIMRDEAGRIVTPPIRRTDARAQSWHNSRVGKGDNVERYDAKFTADPSTYSSDTQYRNGGTSGANAGENAE